MKGLLDLCQDLETPALIVDSDIMKANITRMAETVMGEGVALRPHVKTHKSPELAKLQLKAGAKGIAVAKLSEAEVMADAGITNIQIANEIVGPVKLERVARLSGKCDITIIADNARNARTIGEAMSKAGVDVGVLIDIDIGYKRTGIPYSKPEKVVKFAKLLDSTRGISFRGIMCHAGQAYGAEGMNEVRRIGLHEGKNMVALAKAIRKAGADCQTVSVGSTPTARFACKVEGVTEIRTGNYIFNDNTQISLGVAKEDDCALRVLATVTSTPSRSRAVNDAGSKALGPENRGLKYYGRIVGKRAEVVKLSEEHGFLAMFGKGERFTIGERLQIIPNHACFTVNLYDNIVSPREGKGYRVAARGCSQ